MVPNGCKCRLETSLHWQFSTPDVKNKGKPIESPALLIEQIPNCKFYILAEHRPGLPNELVITVRKSNPQPAEIHVVVKVNKRITFRNCSREATNWISDQQFHFHSRNLDGIIFEVCCQIIWPQPLLGLCNDVEPFLLSPRLSDFTIVMDKEELPVHKFILGARSSVFLAMFESDMQESTENRVIIEDIRLDVMKNVLSFLYTESEEALDDWQMALDMWIVADKYNIGKLKDVCKIKLHELITKSNVLEIFEHAIDHGPEELRQACLKFVEHYKKEMANEPHFKNSFFEKPQLMYTLFYDRLMSQKHLNSTHFSGDANWLESNVLEIFEHTGDHGLEELRGACLKFIKNNKKKMADVPQFKTSFFEKPKLMYTLFYELLRNAK